jgi:hypothetical protein
MTVILYQNQEAETQNATVDWAEKVSASGPLPDGEAHYMIWASAEYTGSATNKNAEVRVLLDGAEVALEQLTPPVTNQIRVFNSFGLVVLNGGTHSIALEFRAGSIPNTVRCRRARILVMKH